MDGWYGLSTMLANAGPSCKHYGCMLAGAGGERGGEGGRGGWMLGFCMCCHCCSFWFMVVVIFLVLFVFLSPLVRV